MLESLLEFKNMLSLCICLSTCKRNSSFFVMLILDITESLFLYVIVAIFQLNSEEFFFPLIYDMVLFQYFNQCS